uniref:Chitin-binding type-2 domain-containing protein n=1 Tax=Arion vulgaris TaxID=1028688 RepID=A0A0B7ABL8_9EUPU
MWLHITFLFFLSMMSTYCFDYYYYDPTICENVQPGLWVRDTVDCTISHQCGFDMEVIQSIQCNSSQVWSKLASACVWEWDPDRDDCNGRPHTAVHGDPRCIKRTGNNAHPDDCSKFLSCSNGTMIAEQKCSDGTLYWPKNQSCEFAEDVVYDCGQRKIPVSVRIYEEDPICQHNGQVPDPKSCQHFIQCLNGKKLQRIQCPHGTAFSDKTHRCEWYEEVNCGSRVV